MRATRFYVVGAAVLVVLLVGGISGYAKYSQWSAVHAAQLAATTANRKAVAVQTAATSNVLKTEDANSQQTYAQLFERVDDVAKKSDDSLVEIQASDADAATKSVISDYFNVTENTLRAIESKYRKALDLSNKIDTVKSANHDYASTPYNEYSDGWERKRISDAKSEMNEAGTAYKTATQDCIKSLEALSAWMKANGSKLDGYSLIDSALVEKALKKSRDDLKDVAQF